MTTAKVPVLGLPDLVVDLDILTQFLNDCGAVTGKVVELQLLAGGISNLTLRVRSDKGVCVIRRRPFGKIPERAHDMGHEFRVLSGLADTGVPVPRVFAYCGDESLLGAPFYAMELVEGIVLQDRVDADALTESQRALVSEDLARVLAEMHSIPLATLSTYQDGRGRNFVRRQIDRWHERWQTRPHRDLPMMDTIADRLRTLVPQQEDVSLLHGDYRLGNSVVNLGKERPVAAVLDWELSTFGNPLTDLAHLVAYWEPTGDCYSHRAQHIAKAPGFLTGAELADRYSTLSGRPVEDLPFYIAYEHWRGAVIKEGVYQRRLEIRAPTDEAEDSRLGVDGHITEALARLERV